jgi:undecaprenyl-diphosphatase
MEYLLVILFGVVQGITEFLPISSSGHLILLHNFISLPVEDNMAFDVFLHFATLLAIVICFRSDIYKLVRSFIASLGGKKDEYSRTGWLIIMATLPAAFLGLLLEDKIEEYFHGASGQEIMVVAFMLFAVALLFIFVEKRKKGEKLYTALSRKEALLVGFAQALALIPGTSRSGITIIAGLWGGLKREEALRFSFLLSIPVILGASVTKIPRLFENGIEGWSYILCAFIATFVSGVLAIRFFLRFAETKSLIPFAYYRIALALVLLLYLFV